jgi:hypothetical protein
VDATLEKVAICGELWRKFVAGYQSVLATAPESFGILRGVSRSLDRGKVTMDWFPCQFVGVYAGLLAVMTLSSTTLLRFTALAAPAGGRYHT